MQHIPSVCKLNSCCVFRLETPIEFTTHWTIHLLLPFMLHLTLTQEHDERLEILQTGPQPVSCLFGSIHSPASPFVSDMSNNLRKDRSTRRNIMFSDILWFLFFVLIFSRSVLVTYFLIFYMYIKQGDEFTACSLTGMYFSFSHRLLQTGFHYSVICFTFQKSHPHNKDFLWNADPRKFAIQIQITLVREKGLNIKYPKVHMWSWMIACHVSSDFPLMTYSKCHEWFTHLPVCPGSPCGTPPVQGLAAVWSSSKWELVTHFNGICQHTHCLATHSVWKARGSSCPVHLQRQWI